MGTILLIFFALLLAYLWGMIDSKTPEKIVSVVKSPLEKMIWRQMELMKYEKIRLGIKQRQFKTYQHYLGSHEWNRISKSAAGALNCKCEFCGEAYESVHHWRYPDIEDRSNENIASLIVVCKRCHNTLHGHNAADKKVCALCRVQQATSHLDIAIRRAGQSASQAVCGNCKLIATGHRYKASKSNFADYEIWVEKWQAELLSIYKKY